MTDSVVTRRSSGLLPFLGRILGAGLLAAAVTLAAWFLLGRISFPAFSNSNATKALASAGAVVVLGVLAVVIFTMLHTKEPQSTTKQILRVLICWLAPAGLVITVLGVPLAATRLYLGGISVDQAFRTQFLTQMTADPGYGDMAYLDIPSFYPRLWFLTGGIFAQLTGLSGWAAFQPWALVSLAATASILVPVWHRITGSLPLGSVIAATTTLAVLYLSPQEPYAAIVALGMPAAVVLAGRAMRGSRPAMLGLAIYLGISANLYTLYTGISALAVVLIAGIVAWQAHKVHTERPAADTNDGVAPRNNTSRAFLTPLFRLLGVGIGSMLIAAIGWAPYFLAILTSAHGATGRAQHYLPEEGTEIPIPFFEFSMVGVLGLLCLVWMVWHLRNHIVQSLLAGLVVSYGWIVLSMIAPLAGTTLLGFRVETPVTLFLVTGGVFALDHLRRSGVEKAYPAIVTPHRAPQVTAILGLLLTFATISYAVSIPLHLRDEVDFAYTDTDGDAQRGDTLPADSTVYFAEVDATIQELRRENSAQPDITASAEEIRKSTVILTDEQGFMAYYPYPVFQAISAHYANPLGEFEARNAEIEHWSTLKNPVELREAMDRSARDNGWASPDVFLFRGQLDGNGAQDDVWTYRISEDIYPNDPNVRFRPVNFHASAFNKGWTLRQIGPFVLAVRQEQVSAQ